METPTTDQLAKCMRLTKRIESLEKQKATAEKNYQAKMKSLDDEITLTKTTIRSLMGEKTTEG